MKTVFVGNRFLVLEQALARGLDVIAIHCVPGSFLEKECERRGIPFQRTESRHALVASLHDEEFDLLLSNGCPWILPISALNRPGRVFVNVHPSRLPDLRGKHPVNGAILYGRDAGATCHLMQDAVDTGPVIAQTVIPLTDDIDAGLLYQMCFAAEADVFNAALDRRFTPADVQPTCEASFYYTRSDRDLDLDLDEAPDTVVRRIRAFGIPSLGARFTLRGMTIRVLDACVLANPYLRRIASGCRHRQVLFVHDDTVVVSLYGVPVKLTRIIGDLSGVVPGTCLEPESGAKAPTRRNQG